MNKIYVYLILSTLCISSIYAFSNESVLKGYDYVNSVHRTLSVTSDGYLNVYMDLYNVTAGNMTVENCMSLNGTYICDWNDLGTISANANTTLQMQKATATNISFRNTTKEIYTNRYPNLNVTGNMTVYERVKFKFGLFLEQIVDYLLIKGSVLIQGSLNVTGSVNATEMNTNKLNSTNILSNTINSSATYTKKINSTNVTSKTYFVGGLSNNFTVDSQGNYHWY